MKQSRKGFTLVELLVVILIIGVLAAIALPMYQKAVLKSRFSAMMPIAKAMAESNEVYYLDHGTYAENPEELTIQGKDTTEEAYADGTTILMYSNEEDLSFVRTENANIPNARYVVYQKHSKNFAGTTWCEAGDERAEAMCVALGGVIPDGVSGNSGMDADWTAYLLSGEAKAGDSFAEAGTNGGADTPDSSCNAADKPDDIAPTSSNPATGKATCVNGQWKYVWTGGTVYEGDYSSYTIVCTGDSAYACAGAEFKGENNVCSSTEENGCAQATFSGDHVRCYTTAANGCTSTFSGSEANCGGSVDNACAGAIFSGDRAYCSSERSGAYVCAGAIIEAGAYCNPSQGSCEGALYGAHPGKDPKLLGSCYDYKGRCPTGVPLRGEWNEDTHAYNIAGWAGGYCVPSAMVTGECPAGSPVRREAQTYAFSWYGGYCDPVVSGTCPAGSPKQGGGTW